MPPVSFREAIRRFELELDDNEAFIASQERALLAIFDSAERQLFARRSELFGLLNIEGGRLTNRPEDLANVEQLIEQIRGELRPALIDPAREWADVAIPDSFKRGRRLARVSMDHQLIDERAVGEAFVHVSPVETGILRVGIEDTYRITATVGDDVAEWFRRELTESIILGLPVQGEGSLAERLYESGRLRPQTVRSSSGRLITRSVRQRSIAIARVETSKVINRTNIQKGIEVLGRDALYININPEDDRTTDICSRASRQGPMTLADWDRSEFGRPPRLRPFHVCRSHLFVVPSVEALVEIGHPQAYKEAA